jgi:hypothetical protein
MTPLMMSLQARWADGAMNPHASSSTSTTGCSSSACIVSVD